MITFPDAYLLIIVIITVIHTWTCLYPFCVHLTKKYQFLPYWYAKLAPGKQPRLFALACGNISSLITINHQ